jgi:hypothetical protein
MSEIKDLKIVSQVLPGLDQSDGKQLQFELETAKVCLDSRISSFIVSSMPSIACTLRK